MDSKASAGGKTQHPLPKTQRPHVSVDEVTLGRWKQDALEDIDSVLSDQNSWFYGFDQYLQRHEYKLLLDKPYVRGGGRVRPEDSQTVDFLCRVELDLTLDDVVLALHNASNLEQRLAFAQIYQDIVLDAALIKLYEQETDEDPFHCVSIKWIAFDSPARQILRHRDCLYFEFCCTTQDALGHPVLVEYKRSVDLDPDQLRDHGLDMLRRQISTLTTYRMEDDKVVSKVRGVNEPPKGPSRARVSMNYLPIVFARYLNLNDLPHSKALLRAGVRASALATRQSAATFYCHSCRHRFGITTRKAWCRACSRTVCRHCTCKLILPVDGDQIAPRLPVVRARFCRGCIIFAHSQTRVSCGPRSLRSTSDSDGFSCVDSDSFFGTLDRKALRSARVDSVDTPMLPGSRLERMLARLSLGSDLHQEPNDDGSLTDESSDSSHQLIFADDGMRVFTPKQPAIRPAL